MALFANVFTEDLRKVAAAWRRAIVRLLIEAVVPLARESGLDESKATV